MARTPARRAAPPALHPHCIDNDCQRVQADALNRLANHADTLLDPEGKVVQALHDLGEIAGKWLRFCAFVRKWFPKFGWWLIPIVMTLLTKGSGEATDALIAAATTWFQMQAGAGG